VGSNPTTGMHVRVFFLSFGNLRAMLKINSANTRTLEERIHYHAFPISLNCTCIFFHWGG
jgi:hypothetical protein